MSNKEKIQRYVEAMGYLTRAEGYITYEKQKTEGEVPIETVDAVKRAALPEYMGQHVDIVV
jgi:hypothetical protein